MTRATITQSILVGALLQLGATDLLSQGPAGRDSLRLRYTRIYAEPTATCRVIVLTSGTMNIQATLSPAEIRQWIDTATHFIAATPVRAKGQRIRMAYIPLTIGFKRTITDRFDAVALTNSGHEIPVLRSEVPRLARLLSAAAVKAEELASASGCTARGARGSPGHPA